MVRMFFFLVFITVAVAGWLFYSVLSAEHDEAVWHVDPLTEPQTIKPHSYRMAPPALTEEFVDIPSPVFSANPTLMAKAFDDFVMRQNKTIRLAGSPDEGWMTYVQRTPSLSFPDYISVKFFDLNGGKSTIAIYSRSRFGYSDQGVNEARVTAWVGALQSFVEVLPKVDVPPGSDSAGWITPGAALQDNVETQPETTSEVEVTSEPAVNEEIQTEAPALSDN